MIITIGGTGGLLLLLVGLAFGGWPVLAALAIFAVIGSLMLAAASWRRSARYVEHSEGGAQGAESGTSEPSRAGGNPRSGGAPASGEG